MIETLGTYTALEAERHRVEGWMRTNPPGWRVTSSSSTAGDFPLRAVLSGEHTPLGRVMISQNLDATNRVSPYVVTAEGNLPVMLHGQAAKHLTMLPGDLPAAVLRYVDALHEAVPLLGDVFSAHRLTRVDASMTWRHQNSSDAAHALAQARSHLNAQRSGRRVVSTHGLETVTCRYTKQHLVRAYDKTAEMIARFKGTGIVPDLGPGTLTRLEVQLGTKHARRHYGDTTAVLSRLGAVMARIAVETAAEPFARALVDVDTTSAQADFLIAAGATPSRAFLLLGVAGALAEGGISVLTSRGVPLGTAYQWRAELRHLAGEAVDEATAAAEEHVIEEDDRRQEVLWDVEQAAYYDGTEG